MADTPYFEIGWSILSTIGIFYVLLGLTVIAITRLSTISSVPVIVSCACAIANGMCFYANYEDHPRRNIVAASITADICWLIQEAGLSFYSYFILTPLLRKHQLRIFQTVFWTMITILVGLRTGVTYLRVQGIVTDSEQPQSNINRIHIAYFIVIAFNETWCSYYLLSTFVKARTNALQWFSSLDLWRYLVRSTAFRLTALAIIGICRACVYPFQQQARIFDNPSQLDRFAYALECLFPGVMLIDLLAAKLPGRGQHHAPLHESRNTITQDVPNPDMMGREDNRSSDLGSVHHANVPYLGRSGHNHSHTYNGPDRSVHNESKSQENLVEQIELQAT